MKLCRFVLVISMTLLLVSRTSTNPLPGLFDFILGAPAPAAIPASTVQAKTPQAAPAVASAGTGVASPAATATALQVAPAPAPVSTQTQTAPGTSPGTASAAVVPAGQSAFKANTVFTEENDGFEEAEVEDEDEEVEEEEK